MKALLIIILAIIVAAVHCEILTLMAVLAGGVGFIGMIVNAKTGGE